MTLTEEEVTEPAPSEEGDRATVETPVRRRQPAQRVVRLAAVGVVGILIVYAFFGAFVTHLWFQTRQRSLAAEGLSLVKVKPGHSVGTLQVQTPFVMNLQVIQGDSPSELESAPGHKPSTPLPGTRGNSVVYGHEKLWGGPFAHLKTATTGTTMYLRTPAQATYAYTVVANKVVPPAELHDYLGKSNDFRLTMITDSGSRFSDNYEVIVAISGVHGTENPAPAGSKAGPPGQPVLGRTSLELVGWVVAAGLTVLLLRRSYRRGVVVLAAMPLVLGALVWLFIDVAVFWSPLA